MGFDSELVVRQRIDPAPRRLLDPEERWELAEPLVYRGNREEFTVPAGFVSDFASVPIPFRWLIASSGRHSKAAVLHDFLWREPRPSSYRDADGLFRRALHDLGVPFLRRWTMWAAVRWASLVKTAFRDGARDLPRVLLVTVAPGALVLGGGTVVLALLLAFAAVELVAAIPVALLRLLGVDEKVKKVRKPTVLW